VTDNDDKLLRIVVGYAAGGATDTVARMCVSSYYLTTTKGR
jgi:tripartite-type tricarboxylate transporter receptor subunit TctC